MFSAESLGQRPKPELSLEPPNRMGTELDRTKPVRVCDRFPAFPPEPMFSIGMCAALQAICQGSEAEATERRVGRVEGGKVERRKGGRVEDGMP